MSVTGSDDSWIPGFSRLELVGRGGMSSVYRAYQDGLDRVVAIKVLELEDAPVDPLVEATLSSLGGIVHPNVVTILETGVDSRGHVYIVTPYYPAGSLQDRVASQGALELDVVLRMGVKLASAVAALHQFGILHCDIKPGNVLLDSFGEVVLADFGIARRSTGGTNDVPAFTLGYSAPELFEDGAEWTTASDVYSLAETLYTLLSGRPRFNGGFAEVLRAKLSGSVLPEPADGPLPQLLTDELNLCLGPDPKLRPSARELGEALQEVQRSLRLPVTEFLETQDPPPVMGRVSPPFPSPEELSDPIRVGVPVAPTGPDASPPSSPMSPSPNSTRTPLDEPAGDATRLKAAPPAAAGGSSERKLRHGWGRRLGRLSARGSDSSTGSDPDKRQQGAGAGGNTRSTLGMLAADRPTDQDRLGLEPLVLGLGRLLDDPNTALPLTIGIGGHWGAGKSSLMLQLARYLKSPRRDVDTVWDVVRFDAWRFQGREAIWVGLARAIYQQSRRDTRMSRAVFRVRLEIRRRGLLKAVLAVLLFATGAALAVSITSERFLGHGFLVSAGFAAASLSAIAVAVGYLGIVGQPFVRALNRNVPGRAFEDFLGVSHSAERDIECLLRSVAPDGTSRAVLVLLDDLDRCSPSTITETLATVTELFAKHEGQPVAFILGVDLDIVASAIAHSLRDISAELAAIDPRRAAQIGDQYLEKIFQLSVNVSGRSRIPASQLLLDSEAFGEQIGSVMDLRVTHDGDEIRSWVERLEALNLRNPAEATIGGFRSSRTLIPTDLGAMREAVREVRVSLLSASSVDVRNAEVTALRALNLTPRAIKRFDNAFRLQLQVANGTPGSQLGYSREEMTALGKWVALRMFFPRLSRVVDREPGLLGELESLAKDQEALGLVRRLQDLVPDAPSEVGVEAAALIRTEVETSPMTRIPLESFTNTS